MTFLKPTHSAVPLYSRRGQAGRKAFLERLRALLPSSQSKRGREAAAFCPRAQLQRRCWVRKDLQPDDPKATLQVSLNSPRSIPLLSTAAHWPIAPPERTEKAGARWEGWSKPMSTWVLLHRHVSAPFTPSQMLSFGLPNKEQLFHSAAALGPGGKVQLDTWPCCPADFLLTHFKNKKTRHFPHPAALPWAHSPAHGPRGRPEQGEHLFCPQP